jgi:AraC family transcriptional regulator, regulatory protein of adaptative response / DNA-3-methyladenine glycosylase II
MRTPVNDSKAVTSHDPLYEAMRARDARFDGKFFVAVKTTGIYCRPICPARPKRRNVEFFRTAQAAEEAGYRPCLRCRPESAPGSPAWNGTRATVQRALKLIAQGALAQHTEEAFAARLGVTARHLRRLFEEAFGYSPKQLHDVTRLNIARKLIVETHLPMTEIAFAAGFGSLRRFNDAIKQRFHRPPSALRSFRKTASAAPMVRLLLSFRPPFDWPNLMGYYQRHQIVGVEAVEGGVYSRVFHLRDSGTTGYFRARLHPRKPALMLEMMISDTRQLLNVLQRVKNMFDVDADPTLVAEAFTRSPVFKRLYAQCPGARLARGFDPFETAIGAILGQVISVSQATRLTSQLVATYGTEIRHPLSGEPVRIFPSPHILARSDLRALKITGRKRAAIREFSARVAAGDLEIDPAGDLHDFRVSVRAIPGIGAWTAEYIALRAFGDSDAFPETDLVVQRFMKENPEADFNLIRPWRGYLAVCLWTQNAHASHERMRLNHAVVHAHGITGRTAQTRCLRSKADRGAVAG